MNCTIQGTKLCTVQNSTIQYSTVSDNTVQKEKDRHLIPPDLRSDVVNCTIQKDTILRSGVLDCTVQYSTIQILKGRHLIPPDRPGDEMNFFTHKESNKKVKCTNGNIDRSIKVAHWNLGSSYWDKKVEEVQLFVDELNPDIAIILEANLFSGLQSHLRHIQGYTLQYSKGFQSLGCSRIVMLIRQGFNADIQDSWMEEDLATIWIKIKRRGCQSIMLGAIYREHRLLLQGYPNR